MNIAIIPARGGSKRILKKNLKPFCGRPILHWPIRTALTSGCYDQVIVSTDDDEIAASAIEGGASVPFRRPIELADDYTTTRVVINHAINEMELQGATLEKVCCLYATAVFVEPSDLCAGQEALDVSGVKFAFSVATYSHPIQRALRRLPDGGIELFWPEHEKTRTQDLEEAHYDAGQFYWGWREAFLSEQTVFCREAKPIFLPHSRVHDIDTPEDWARAELIFQALHGEIHP